MTAMTERDLKLVVASSPHVHSPLSTQKIMGLVIAALVPAGVAGVHFMGWRALAVIVVCVAASVAAEYLWQRATGQRVTVSDLSAAVTGLLLAYNLPPSVPLWMAACGAVFAIVVVKQFFGGIGGNVMNPALAARAMMLISWPVAMTSWSLDGVSTATPLAAMKALSGAGVSATSAPSWSTADLLLGNVGGCIGETSAALLLLGGVFLVWQEVISWRIPVVYTLTAALLAALFRHGGGMMPLQEALTGGLLLGAIFMATDYTTSPITARGQVVFAVGCGVLTALIRRFGGYPEGVSYSILIMNATVPLIDRVTKPRILGEVRR